MPSSNATRKRHKTRSPGIYYRQDRNGDRAYEVAYRDENGKLCQPRVHGDFEDAKAFRAAKLAEVDDRRARAQRGEPTVDMTFVEVEAEYRRSRDWTALAAGTQTTYGRALRNYVTPTFGDVLVSSIDKRAVARWLDALRTQPRQRRRGDRTEGVSESTVNNALTALRVVLRHAKDEGYIDRNPVDDVPKRAKPKPSSDSRDVRVLDESELARLFATASDPFALMFRVKAYTGLRGSELRGLIWGDLDLDAGRATITRQMDDADKGERVALKSKTLRERRTVPLIGELQRALRDRLAREQEHGRGKPADWVFTHDGGHVTYPTLAYRFEAAVTDAGLGCGPDLTPHALRHTFGSLMLAYEHPLVTVSAWLGHTRTSTTERWYVHQVESMHDAAGDRMRAQMDARETVNVTVNTDPLPVAPAESRTVPGVRS